MIDLNAVPIRVGQILGDGKPAQSLRTKKKLSENAYKLADGIMNDLREIGIEYPLAERYSFLAKVSNALGWIADDVLLQAVADGYVGKELA